MYVILEQVFDFDCPVDCPGIWYFGNPLPFWVCGAGEYSSPVSRSFYFPLNPLKTLGLRGFSLEKMLGPLVPSRVLLQFAETQCLCGFALWRFTALGPYWVPWIRRGKYWFNSFIPTFTFVLQYFLEKIKKTILQNCRDNYTIIVTKGGYDGWYYI